MEAARKRNIQSGEQYSHAFPKAEGNSKTIRKNADVTHTVAFIPKVVGDTLNHTKSIAQLLKTNNPYETCSAIWHFVYRHIAYRKDQDGYEQIRSPARVWHDRKSGVDCDCYSVFISSILTNLRIPHILRITKYHRDYFQHIYPVVVLGGRQIPIDCVTDKFNYEVPYSEKKDYPMDLQYLNGFDEGGMGELGKLLRKKVAKPISTATTTPVKRKPSLFQKLKAKSEGKKQPGVQPAPKAQHPLQPVAKKQGFVKKALNKINKVNPSTVLLRNGILAAMKLNVKNVAARLRWSYLSPTQAAQKDIDPQKFQRLVATREKLEKIFYGAGGSPKNLKEAMLSGKGNKDKAVAGLEGVANTGYMNAYTPLPQLLGPHIYHSENVAGMQGFSGLGQLGEPLTLASVGAAMGVLTGIVTSLKQIGNIFKKKSEGSKDFDPSVNEAAEANQPVPGTTPIPEGEAKAAAKEAMTSTQSGQQAEQTPLVQSASSGGAVLKAGTTSYDPPISTSLPDEIVSAEPSNTAVNAGNAATMTTAATADNITPSSTGESYWDKNKSWLKPVAIGAGGIGLIAIGMAALKPSQPSRRAQSSRSLSGLPKTSRKNHKRKAKPKPKHGKKTAVALL